ncbi:LysM peptidoglycan-binding domain-containing protein, partial [Bacteroidota bacterium]
MTLIHFINILQRRILLIILVPVILAASVFIFTRKQARSYQSETTIYTGVGSGYSVQQNSNRDYLSTNIAFDNLINLINARQTLEEVSIRLLAQELLLDRYNPKYILQESYEELMESVPPEVLLIVRKYKRKQQQQNYKPPQTTADLTFDDSQGPTAAPLRGNIRPKQEDSRAEGLHLVRIGETLYSIAKQYRVSVEELMSLNDLESYELSAGQKIRVNDQIAAVQRRFDPNPSPANNNSQNDSSLNSYTRMTDDKPVTDSTWISGSSSKAGSDSTSQFELLIRELMHYATSNNYNWIYKIWSSDNKFYSIKALSAIKTNRIGSSDLIRVSYTCQDPGICQQTLIFLTETFIRNYKNLKQNQTDAVIAYFKNQVEDAMSRLNQAERQLLQFNEKNKIINYYEQTKAIAISKEDLDITYQNRQIAFAAADAAIKIIEKKLETHANLTLNSSSLLELRSELSSVTMEIVNLEIDLGNDSSTIRQLNHLRGRVDVLKSEIKDNIDRLTMINSSVEGIPLQELLYSWLTNVIAYEESKAALRVLSERKRHFQQIYEIFAPLGAEMKRFERLIGVTEDEFLQLLHDLNLAKLRQQDDELRTNLKVVDPPFYPI